MNLNSLRFRLLMAFLALAVVPVLVGGGILAWQSYELRVAEIQDRQRDLAARMAVELDSFFHGIEDKLANLDLVREFTGLDAETQRRRLAVVLAERHDFRALAVLDEHGRERAKVSASEPVAAADLRSLAEREEFRWPSSHRTTYSGPIRFDPETGEPLMLLAVPLLDGRDGPAKAVVVAELRVRRLWELMQESGMMAGQAVAIVDAGGRVIAHRNPSVVLRETRLAALPADGRGPGIDGLPAYVVAREFRIGQQPFTLVAEYTVAEALAPAKRAIAIIGGVVLLAVSMVMVLAWLAVRRIVRPVEAVSAAAKAVRDGDLTRRVEVGGRADEIGELAKSFNAMTGELQAAIDQQRKAIEERRLAEAAVIRANQELERRVEERTEQLEASNRELEAFSYSVSHDLRAPLRAIDGFSNIVLEDYGDKLDDEGRRLLGVVRQNTVRMGQLINDILSFSRSGRQEMAAAAVDMEKLAREVADEQLAAAPERNIRFEIGPLPPAWGDRALLRQVLVNLFSNAVKFTGTRPEAVIEAGGTGGEENSYFVKDNGAGFDMQYAEKLFGVFQRLHTQEEFEGTGIGLAIVKRIVARHGGRVWAEGKLGEGATLHFTLPPARSAE